MINKIEEVTLASSYCKAVKQVGLIILSIVVLVASFLAFKGVFSFGGVITIVLLLLIFSALAASSGGITFTRENIEISRKIILYKYYLSLPTNRFSKLKIMLKYSSSIGEAGSTLYYLELITREELGLNMSLMEVTGTVKATEIYMIAQRVSSATGLPLEIDEHLKDDFPV
jgi:hypothetical protein